MKDIGKRGMMTRIIHAGQHVDPQTGAVATPIYQTSTFAFRDADHAAACFGGETGYKYTRLGNPTTEALENNVAQLEGACGGLGAASGMAAVNMVYLTLLGGGAFGNDDAWIGDGLLRALALAGGMDVRIVSYGRPGAAVGRIVSCHAERAG